MESNMLSQGRIVARSYDPFNEVDYQQVGHESHLKSSPYCLTFDDEGVAMPGASSLLIGRGQEHMDDGCI